MMPVRSMSFMRAPAFVLLVCWMVLSGNPAAAGSFSLKPVQIRLGAGNAIDRMTVQNTGGTELNLELKPFLWKQTSEGKDEYDSAGGDIVVFPRMLTLRPNEERIIRIGAKQKPGPAEKTYRLFIEEIALPEKNTSKTSSVRLLMKASVPVFVAPARTDDRGVLSSLVLQQGKLAVTVKNEGNSHWFIQSVTAGGVTAQGEPFKQEVNGWYLLAGAARTYALQIPGSICMNLMALDVLVQTDKLSLKGKLDVDKRQCGP